MTAAMKRMRRIGCSEKQVATLVLMAAVCPVSQGCRLFKTQTAQHVYSLCWFLFFLPLALYARVLFIQNPFEFRNMHIEFCFLRTSSLCLPVILPYFRSNLYRYQHRMHALKQLHSARASMPCVQLCLEDFQGKIYKTVAFNLSYKPISLCLVLSLSLLNRYVTNKFDFPKRCVGARPMVKVVSIAQRPVLCGHACSATDMVP